MLSPLRIVIDLREQTPWAWTPDMVTPEMKSLNAGDYALAEDCEAEKGKKSLSVRFAIERKSLDDFLGTIGSNWDRFQREMERMNGFPARIIIVEGNFADLCFREDKGVLLPPEHSHPNMRPSFVARRIAELALSGITTLFAGDASLAAGLAYRIFRRRHESLKESATIPCQ